MDVQLFDVGAACTSGSSVACDSQADGHGSGLAERGVRQAVLGLGATVDRARVCAAGALLLQAFYSVLSERQLVEQLDYNLLFRWFVGLGMDDAVWSHAVFSKNRDRLLTSELAQQFFAEVNRQAKPFMSDDHFTIEGWLKQTGPIRQVKLRGLQSLRTTEMISAKDES